MNYYSIADLTVSVKNTGEALQRLMKPYEITVKKKADITMNIDRERMNKDRAEYPHLSLDEWEYIQTGYVFACKMLDFGGFCLHSSAVALDGRAVLFSGPCGTGKSTHTNLWQQYFGTDHAVIINDDKPVLRMANDIFYAHGTPWSGKSTLNTNIRVPLASVVFLHQAKENHIRRMTNKEAVQMLVYQSMKPCSDRNRMDSLLMGIDELLKRIPVYRMECNISFDAVTTVYNEIYQ